MSFTQSNITQHQSQQRQNSCTPPSGHLKIMTMICDWQKHFPLIFQTNQYVLGLRTQTSKAKGIRDVYTKSLPALPARVTRLALATFNYFELCLVCRIFRVLAVQDYHFSEIPDHCKKDVSYQTFSGNCEQKCFKTNKSLTLVWLIPHYLGLGYINLGCDQNGYPQIRPQQSLKMDEKS